MRISQRPANHLRFYRKRADLQQKQVAEMLGLKSTSIISRWENSVSYPDLINAFRLAIIYGVMVDALYADLRRLVKYDIGKMK